MLRAGACTRNLSHKSVILNASSSVRMALHLHSVLRLAKLCSVLRECPTVRLFDISIPHDRSVTSRINAGNRPGCDEPPINAFLHYSLPVALVTNNLCRSILDDASQYNNLYSFI